MLMRQRWTLRSHPSGRSSTVVASASRASGTGGRAAAQTARTARSATCASHARAGTATRLLRRRGMVGGARDPRAGRSMWGPRAPRPRSPTPRARSPGSTPARPGAAATPGRGGGAARSGAQAEPRPRRRRRRPQQSSQRRQSSGSPCERKPQLAACSAIRPDQTASPQTPNAFLWWWRCDLAGWPCHFSPAGVAKPPPAIHGAR
mmetsp:Transcript_81450/g.225584  ORF Transcript_81450/g.225584 Transcript_81450/m.225584 type:complete len:205 (+) Transcript_81450:412-1026(+)